FLATRAPTAADDFARTSAALEDTSRSWLQARSQACEATRERHEQPEAALLLRLACLDRQKDDLAAMIALLEHADVDLVHARGRAVHQLPLPAVCANARSLAYVEPP